MRKIILVDIDGTIADINHRLYHIQNKIRNYRAFFYDCDKDTPIDNIIHIVKLLSVNYDIVFCTGRSEECRDKTKVWLDKYVGIDYKLLMRKEGDKRGDVIGKPESVIQAGIKWEDITLVFEDRNTVVSKWRDLGLTCIQVLEGEINPEKGNF